MAKKKSSPEALAEAKRVLGLPEDKPNAKSRNRKRSIPGMPVATMSPGPELNETAELGLLGSTKVVTPKSESAPALSADAPVETAEVKDVSKENEDLVAARTEAQNILKSHKKEHGTRLDEDHPEYQKRLELEKNVTRAKDKVKNTRRDVRNLAAAGGVSKKGTNQFSTKTASVASELGLDDLSLHKQHLQDMQFHAQNAENAATPEAAAGHLAKADEARNRARALDVELRLGERASGIHTACPTEGCHGVSNTGLCADCTTHENEYGENTGKRRIRALRNRLTGQKDTADVDFGETPAPGEPEHEFVQRTGIKDALQYRRARAERAPRTGEKVEQPTELSESQKSEDKSLSGETRSFNGMNWWDATVTRMNLPANRHRKEELKPTAILGEKEETPVGGRKRPVSPLLTGEQEPEVSPAQKQPPIGGGTPTPVSLVEAGVRDFTEDEVKARAEIGLGPKIGQKLGRSESFTAGRG